jgi:hypothetical protein
MAFANWVLNLCLCHKPGGLPLPLLLLVPMMMMMTVLLMPMPMSVPVVVPVMRLLAVLAELHFKPSARGLSGRRADTARIPRGS